MQAGSMHLRQLSDRIGDSKKDLATLAKIAEGLDYAIAERLPPDVEVHGAEQSAGRGAR